MLFHWHLKKATRNFIPFLKNCLVLLGVLLIFPAFVYGVDRPNILWITAEDHGPELGCYGDSYATTPHLDKLAAKGLRFSKCWSVVPVCAPARTAIITGMYPSSLGAEHMRSSVPLPESFRMFPAYLREAGYYCTNNVKEDYNVTHATKPWDESSNKAHWKNRKSDQPFFAVFNFTGTHESQVWPKDKPLQHDPKLVALRSFQPDVPEVRRDWAKYYDNISLSDKRAGELLTELDAAGLSENTIVFYFADHGPGLPRFKRSACNSGLHVPLIVYFPDKWKHLAPRDYEPGGVSDELVSFVDLAPTVLQLAGVKLPEHFQGQPFAGSTIPAPHPFVFGQRGRMDCRYDLVRSCTDGRFVFVKNFAPHLPHGQYVHYMFKNDTARVWRELFLAGELNVVQKRFWQSPRESEELYDLKSDADEVNNLIDRAEYQETANRLRQALHEHQLLVRDKSLLPEPEMIRLAANEAPHTSLNDDSAYPCELVLAAAEEATATKTTVKRLLELKESEVPGVRYWSLVGLRTQLARLDASALDAIAICLHDDNLSVRTIASEIIALKDNERYPAAIQQLFTEIQNNKKNVHALCFVMNTLDQIGNRLKDQPLGTEIFREFPKNNKNWETRTKAGMEDLVPDIQRHLGLPVKAVE